MYNNRSVEEIIDELFNNKVIIDTTQLSLEEIDIIENENIDSISTIENMHYCIGQANLLNFTLQISEEYLWNQSMESDDNIINKFIKFIKMIFIKIRETVLYLYRRMRNFIFDRGELSYKNMWEWFNKNHMIGEFEEVVKSDKYVLRNIRKPKDLLKFIQYKDYIDTPFELIAFKIDSIKILMEMKQDSVEGCLDNFIEEIKIFQDKFEKDYDKKVIENILYGDNKIQEILSAKEFFESIRFHALNNYFVIGKHGFKYNEITKIANELTSIINTFDREVDKLDPKLIPRFRKIFSTIIKIINDAILSYNYFMLESYKLTVTMYKYGKQAI